MIYGSLLDALNQEKKTTMAGQMTLFDIAPEEDKAEYEIKLPNVEEYDKEVLLGFEKEVLGIYISGQSAGRIYGAFKEEYQCRYHRLCTG